jgi:hypothetical protein
MLSEKRSSITGPQHAYLQRLINDCCYKHCFPKTGFDYLIREQNHLDILSMAEASRAINALKESLAKQKSAK